MGGGKWRGDEANNDVIPSRERIRPSIFTRGQYNPGRWKIPSLTASVPGATHAASLKSGTICLIPRYTLRNFAYVGKNWAGLTGRKTRALEQVDFFRPGAPGAFSIHTSPEAGYSLQNSLTELLYLAWLKHIVSDIILCIRAIYYVLALDN